MNKENFQRLINNMPQGGAPKRWGRGGLIRMFRGKKNLRGKRRGFMVRYRGIIEVRDGRFF